MRSSAHVVAYPLGMDEVVLCTVVLRLLVRGTQMIDWASDLNCALLRSALVWMQDGTITFEIKLTGELSTSLLSPGEGGAPRWGTLVAPRVNAQVPPPLRHPAAGRCNRAGAPARLLHLRRSETLLLQSTAAAERCLPAQPHALVCTGAPVYARQQVVKTSGKSPTHLAHCMQVHQHMFAARRAPPPVPTASPPLSNIAHPCARSVPIPRSSRHWLT